MALTKSTMLPLGTSLPHFELPDVVTGKQISSTQLAGYPGTLVMFICRHCPYVIHVQEEIARLGKEYGEKGITMIAISSNDIENYPDDRPEQLKAMAQENGFSFPYCYDEGQEVAKLFTAACTPDFFLFDDNQQLVYRGQLDDSRPGNGKPVTGKDLRAAMDAVLAKQLVSQDQKPSAGCNIKWKAGGSPNYF
ncbi:thioredoxin family protein [Candidatus Nitronereus thalassa]|uniref:Thioredoxin family protein n=1 Tax=Candidatus Nitronereus thalassa TaxID=3020898 RepID=A0ABU3KCJ7_9BACT|nr:thioredoxin family protein [Candidatus Nitronereus thalassa]MDT7044240.1 thioredoxin family protein [Candidatus Nitronereus thalassa]